MTLVGEIKIMSLFILCYSTLSMFFLQTCSSLYILMLKNKHHSSHIYFMLFDQFLNSKHNEYLVIELIVIF